MPTDEPAVADGGLTINEASRLLRVPAPTLRSWERRYALPTTGRTPGGHRRYLEGDLAQLRLMRDEIAIGSPAAAAARRVRDLLDEGSVGRARIEEVLAGSASMDAGAIRDALEAAREQFGLAATLDTVVMPAMREVGARWETGRCDVGQEHFTTEVVRGWLAKLTTLAPAPESDRWVLLAVGPRDLHTVGIEALACLLTQRRIGCRVLGPRTATRVLVTAAVASSAAAVVVVSHLTTQRRPAVESLRAVAATGTPTYYAGNAFRSAAGRQDVPGMYLGETISGAVATIVSGDLDLGGTGSGVRTP